MSAQDFLLLSPKAIYGMSDDEFIKVWKRLQQYYRHHQDQINAEKSFYMRCLVEDGMYCRAVGAELVREQLRRLTTRSEHCPAVPRLQALVWNERCSIFG